MMKRYIFLSILIFSTFQVFSQSDHEEMTWDEFISTVFGSLNQNKISSGILYDRVIGYSNIKAYSGTNADTVIDYENWKQMYSELYNSHFVKPTIPDVFLLDSMIVPLQNNNIIPVGILFYTYNSIKKDAFDKDLLEINGIRIVEGAAAQQETPYNLSQVFVACPMVQNLKEGNYKFVFKKIYYFTNTNQYPLYFEIDCNDGQGFKKYNWNEEIPVSFYNYTSKNITIKAFFNNENLQSKSIINYSVNTTAQKSNKLKSGGGSTGSTSKIIEVTPPDNGATGQAVKQVLSTTASGRYGIWYGNNCKKTDSILDKPFIMVEGFDFNDSRDFVTNKDDKNLYYIANSLGLMDKLRADGYDIVMLNFGDGYGANDIIENAMLVIDLINEINERVAQEGSNQELIVAGTSAGALITRYALAYMEANNMEHHTKLWLSFDGEYQGAYVPLGVQHLLTFFINAVGILSEKKSGEIKKLKESLLDCDQAKQILIYHYSQTKDGIASPHPDFIEFYNKLNTINGSGYPKKCRNIAIANGSINGTTQGFSDEQQELIYFKKITLVFNIEVEVRTLPNNPSDQTMFMKGKAELGGKTVIIDIKKIKNNIPFENVPGGTQKHQENLKPYLDNKHSRFYDGMHCFTPTVSTLDINVSNDYFYNIEAGIQNQPEIIKYGYGYINHSSSLTPFDAFYASRENEKHIIGGVIAPVDSWMLDELSPDNLYLQNRTITQNTDFESRNSIIVGEQVSQKFNQGVFEVNKNAEVNLKAGNIITLRSGTIIKKGSNFRAYIEQYPCPSIVNDPYKSYNLTNENIGPQTNIYNTNKNDEDSFYSFFKLISEYVVIYPNPTTGIFNIDIKNLENINGDLQVFNSFGQLIKNIAINDKTINIDITDYPKGIYFVKISFLNRNIIKKVIMN